jgi:CHAD domain-containing protein
MAHSAEVLDKTTLGKSADLGIRLVALSLVTAAEDAAKAFHASTESFREGSAAGDDSLHDFRVALRRLRSWLRAFDPSFRGSIRRKDKRRLRSIVRTTNAARDASVQSTWLGTHETEIEASRRAGYEVMRSRLNKQREKGVDQVLGAVDKFDRLAPKLQLKNRLEKQAELFGTLLAEAIVEAASALDKSLLRIRDWDNVRREHRARIAAKRLRYLIEPVAKLAEGGEAIVDSLKSLQDLFGDLHDVQVFSSEIARAAKKSTDETEPGLTDLSERSAARGKALYQEIERGWLNGAAEPFFERVRVFAEDIANAAKQ